MTARFEPGSAPTTPFTQAQGLMKGLITSASEQGRLWRLSCFTLMGLLLLSLALNLVQYLHDDVQVFIASVAADGQVLGTTSLPQTFTPTEAMIIYMLEQWITRVRAVPADEVVLRDQLLKAYHYVTDKGRNLLNDILRQSNPLQHIGQRMVSVAVTSIVPISDTSYAIEWQEQAFSDQGVRVSDALYKAVATVVLRTPRTTAEVRANPLGLLIDSFSWSEKLRPTSE